MILSSPSAATSTHVPIQRAHLINQAALVLTSVLFFVVIGPAVGAVVFIPDIGLATFMVAHTVGFVPAFSTGILNALAITTGIVRSRSLAGRPLHALIGGICGFMTTVVFLDYPDWVLMHRTSDWYEFWYTFNRTYVELSMAGMLAGSVCSFTFNPWAQRRFISILA